MNLQSSINTVHVHIQYVHRLIVMADYCTVMEDLHLLLGSFLSFGQSLVLTNGHLEIPREREISLPRARLVRTCADEKQDGRHQVVFCCTLDLYANCKCMCMYMYSVLQA